MRSLLLSSAALVTAAAPFAAQSRSAVDGEHPEYEFRRPLVNGMGVSSLSDLRGKPVLVEFWGTR